MNTQIAVHASLLDHSSKDRVINKPGLQLLELLSWANLYILNGTSFDVSGGSFTYLSTLWASTIDYFAISPALLDLVGRFEVADSPLSDHCPLRLTFNFYTNIFLKPVPEFADDITPGFRRLKWSEQLNTKLSQILANSEMESMKLTLSQPGNDAIKTFEAINGYLKPLFINNRPINFNARNGWYDQECKVIKKKIATLMRLVRRNNYDPLMFQLLKLRSHYKNLIKAKKRDYAKFLWNELELAVSNKNEARFWDIVSSGISSSPRQLDAHILPKDWFQHFSKVFGSYSASLPVVKSQSQTPTLNNSDLPEWAPVSEKEIKGIITLLASGKSPGEDLIPSDFYKAFPTWWSSVLARVFSQINDTGLIPSGWKRSIIVPIHKKGDKTVPQNYRPISLLDIAAKIYSKYLLHKLEDWVTENQIIHPHQAGFRKGFCTVDHCHTLYQLAHAGLNSPTKALYVTFVDLAAAFDSIDRNRLWQKLAELNIDKRLLFLLRELHTDISAQIRVGTSGSLTNKISIHKGVKQGCVLAPLLFNLYINNIVERLSGPQFFPPSLGEHKISILLYADDMVLISFAKIGMRRLLQQLGLYCKEEALSINFEKTKVMVFRKRAQIYNWNILGNPINQCSSFKYLGITFRENLNWNVHIATVKASATRIVGSILRFFHTKGGFLIDPVLKLFKSKVIPHLLYGAEVWGWKEDILNSIEIIQNQFLRRILALPKGTPAALMRAETGLPSLRARVHLAVLKSWGENRASRSNSFCQLSFNLMSSKDSIRNCFLNNLYVRYDIPDDLLSPSANNLHLRDWVFKCDALLDRQSILKSQSASWFKLFKNDHLRSPYLVTLVNHNLRAAFTSLRFETMPTAVLAGRYSKIPREHRFCICGTSAIEDLPHYILDCPMYAQPRSKFLSGILFELHSYSDSEKTALLLADFDANISYRMALYALAAKKIRANAVSRGAN